MYVMTHADVPHVSERRQKPNYTGREIKSVLGVPVADVKAQPVVSSSSQQHIITGLLKLFNITTSLKHKEPTKPAGQKHYATPPPQILFLF